MPKEQRKRLIQGALIGIAVTLPTLLLYFSNLLQWIEYPTWDAATRYWAAPSKSTDKICTIMIDQSSLANAEKIIGVTWKWPREIYGAILSFCQRGGAKAVAFDMLYTERSDSGNDDDQSFGNAIAHGPPCVIALPLSKSANSGCSTNWPTNIASPFQADAIFSSAPGLMEKISMQGAFFPVAPIATNVTLLGNVTAQPDSDAIFRRIAVGNIFAHQFVPSLGLAAYLASHPHAKIKATPGNMVIDGHTIPLSSDGEVILRYRGKTKTHRVLNAAAVLQSELRLREGGKPTIEPNILKGRYVLFGVSAPGLMDLKPTPVGRSYPGVEVHATLLDNFLQNDFAKKLPLSAIILLTLLTAILFGSIGRQCRNWQHTAVLFITAVVTPLAAGFLFWPAAIWFPTAPTEIAAIAAVVAAIVINYAIEGRQKRFIKGAFKQYLSPVVIEKLLQDPNRLQLGGEEKTLSIYFSDIQGFTSVSERLTPSQLTTLLNTYLTAMTDIIHSEGGTIDKYEGDAVIAFWNAPLDQADHPTHAVRAALRCQQKLTQMRPELNKICGSDIFARIGLNTGPVVVGNMGSHQRFDYTFLGDAGNLAARLEGINKQFGTYLMISEFTREQLDDSIKTRELSRVRVVGKQQPITVYEPFLPDDYDRRADDLNAFEDALQLYYAGNFSDAEQAFSKLAEKDPPAAIYAKRCAMLKNDPPHPWDGVWNITEK